MCPNLPKIFQITCDMFISLLSSWFCIPFLQKDMFNKDLELTNYSLIDVASTSFSSSKQAFYEKLHISPLMVCFLNFCVKIFLKNSRVTKVYRKICPRCQSYCRRCDPVSDALFIFTRWLGNFKGKQKQGGSDSVWIY